MLATQLLLIGVDVYGGRWTPDRTDHVHVRTFLPVGVREYGRWRKRAGGRSR